MQQLVSRLPEGITVPLPCIGNWIILMSRYNESFDFVRNWTEYKNGFGDFAGSDFWIGNEKMHTITNWPGMTYMLRVEVELTSTNINISPTPLQSISKAYNSCLTFCMTRCNCNRNRKLEISRAPTKAKSRESDYPEALNHNKIDRQRSKARKSGRQTARRLWCKVFGVETGRNDCIGKKINQGRIF